MDSQKVVGTKFYRLAEVESTNEYVKQMLDRAPEGTVVIADTQSAGKGRMGRSWYSPEGGLWMSVLLQYGHGNLVSLGAGVAVCEALEPFGLEPRMKWPNDILLNNKKIAGILCEIIDDKMVLGIGVNLNVCHFPDDLLNKASSVFIETKKHVDPQSFYHHMCQTLDRNYQYLKEGNVETLLSKWRRYSIMVGRDVNISVHDRKIVGKVLDVDQEGALMVVRADYSIEHVLAGECTLLN